MPICGAASPTPCAAYIDSNMSSTSFFSSRVELGHRFGRVSSTGFRISRSDRSFSESIRSSQLFAVALKVAHGFDHRVAAKFLQRASGQRQCHHGFGGHAGRRHHANIGALVSRLHRLRACQNPPIRSGRRSVEIGFRYPRTTMSSPFETPPSIPPALFRVTGETR